VRLHPLHQPANALSFSTEKSLSLTKVNFPKEKGLFPVLACEKTDLRLQYSVTNGRAWSDHVA
jgi:hypothetical protein